MSDPKRILEGTAGDPVSALEQQLLSSASPSIGQREELLGRVMSEVGVAAAAGIATTTATQAASATAGSAAATGAAATGAAATGATGSTAGAVGLKTGAGLSAVWKTALVVAAPLVLGAGVFALTQSADEGPAPLPRSTEPTHEAQHPAQVTPQAPEQADPSTAQVEEEPESAPQKTAKPEPSDTSPNKTRTVQPQQAPPSPASLLAEENRLIRAARTQWKAGDSEGALSTLNEMQRRFPHGQMHRERQMLRQAISEQEAEASRGAQ